MFIARILYPVRVLGPGNRIGIWFCGCSKKCNGCSNPELWKQQERYYTTKEAVLFLIQQIAGRVSIDGFTITGGDPFEQPDALHELLPMLKEFSKDILVYTGEYYEEVCEKHKDLLQDIAVLIDGPYIKDLNHGSLLKGSDNQRILILNPEFRERYNNYLENAKSEIQNFVSADGIISVGIHLPDYESDLREKLSEKGINIFIDD